MAASYSDWSLYRRLLIQARPYWAHIALLFVIALISSPLNLLSPLPLKIIVDSVLGPHPIPEVIAWAVPQSLQTSKSATLVFALSLLLATALFTQLQWVGSSLLRTYVGDRLVLEFRARLFRHAQRLSIAYHDRKGAADSVYRIQTDASAIQNVAIEGVIPFITSAVTLLGMIYVIARIDWQLMVIAVAVSPLFLAITQLSRSKLRRHSRDVRKLDSSAAGVIQEVLSAVRVVKAFGQEEREHKRFMRVSSASLRARLRLIVTEGGVGGLVGITAAAGTVAVLAIGVQHVQAGHLTVGDLLLVMAYLGRLLDPVKTIGKRLSGMQGHMASAERTFAVLDEAPEVVERPNALPLNRAAGAIAFENVSFSYEPGRAVVRNISFKAAPGARIGLAGRTGAGKTTILSLLMRFYDVESGRVLLDGVDLREFRVADIRNQFAVVLQDPVLFSTNIAENIAYGRPEASTEQIVAAAKIAEAHDFISRLPQGYDTQVGERGMRLSGGERQRISLARAFLKDAPIVILDEPTSSVDLRTEASILSALERLMQGRTSFIISHRLSALEHCDTVLVLQDGCLVAPGSREFRSATVAEGA